MKLNEIRDNSGAHYRFKRIGRALPSKEQDQRPRRQGARRHGPASRSMALKVVRRRSIVGCRNAASRTRRFARNFTRVNLGRLQHRHRVRRQRRRGGRWRGAGRGRAVAPCPSWHSPPRQGRDQGGADDYRGRRLGAAVAAVESRRHRYDPQGAVAPGCADRQEGGRQGQGHGEAQGLCRRRAARCAAPPVPKEASRRGTSRRRVKPSQGVKPSPRVKPSQEHGRCPAEGAKKAKAAPEATADKDAEGKASKPKKAKAKKTEE